MAAVKTERSSECVSLREYLIDMILIAIVSTEPLYLYRAMQSEREDGIRLSAMKTQPRLGQNVTWSGSPFPVFLQNLPAIATQAVPMLIRYHHSWLGLSLQQRARWGDRGSPV